jgi:hypothetical protein
MIALAALFALTFQTQAPSVDGSAYADQATARMVAAARSARDRSERLVSGYHTRVSQRLGIGVHGLARDRMLYRQEVVADIDWRRDSITTVRVVGAREGVPIAVRGDRLPEDLPGTMRELVIDPAGDELRVFGNADDEHGFLLPLAAGAESLYTYRKGPTTTIGLPGGHRIVLMALDVTARRADYRLVNGTFWFDSTSNNLVRAVFRPARPFEMRRDLSDDDLDDVPGFVNATAEVRYLTLEYALQENRWWMPRFIGIDAVARVGTWIDTPFRLERRYEDWEVTGGTPRDPSSTFVPAGRDRDHVRTEGGDVADSNLIVLVPADTAALLTSPDLGAPILQVGDLLTADDIQPLQDAIAALPDRPWEGSVTLPRGTSALLSHARYNRIEGLSLGLGATVDWGKLKLHGLTRVGLADGEPGAELTVERPTPSHRLAVVAFRRLEAANPDNHPLGAVNSLMALMAGRDDGEYFRSTGVAVSIENTVSRAWSARAWVARERTARVEASASLPRLFDDSESFRPNIIADPVTEWGASLSLHQDRALGPTLWLGGDVTVTGATGDMDFGRAELTMRAVITPPGAVAGALTLSAGTSRGDLPSQHRFYLGGSGSLRCYDGGVANGESFWLARGEVATGSPALRLTLFGDVGWAGPRQTFATGRPLLGAGVGVGLLDGLLRIDLARALRHPTGWRLEFYVDGVL